MFHESKLPYEQLKDYQNGLNKVYIQDKLKFRKTRQITKELNEKVKSDLINHI